MNSFKFHGVKFQKTQDDSRNFYASENLYCFANHRYENLVTIYYITYRAYDAVSLYFIGYTNGIEFPNIKKSITFTKYDITGISSDKDLLLKYSNNIKLLG